MDKSTTYPINLYRLTNWEYLRYKETFEQYKQLVFLSLKEKRIFLFEDDLLQKAVKEGLCEGKPVALKTILENHPDRFVPAGVQKRNVTDNEYKEAYIDLWAAIDISPEYPLYDYIFCYYLRGMNILDTDGFLNYTLITHYNNDLDSFTRFLILTLRKHGDSDLISASTIATAKEWIEQKEKQKNLSVTPVSEKNKGKGILKREAGDNSTRLNQEQTALLISYLQKGKIILKDEYLNNKQAGEAFSILTGYSSETLRQDLGTAGLDRIATKKNLTDLYNIFTSLGILVNKDLADKK